VECPKCKAKVLDIDVKCASCGAALAATGAHRMLGAVLLGQYELVDVLGQGGMSVVFKGRHKMTDQEVALKILPPELAAHSQVKSRFLEEAKALAALDHPNIVHLYNFGQENGSFVLAMQYVQGQTWERMIIEAKRLDWVASVRIAIDVLRALEYAHGRGIVHRDMKPSNVLVREHDNAATVMDFGIAKMAQSTRLTATGQTMGTVRYMSPEQVRGQEVDLKTDIYSLGATLYESLVGDTPFDGETHFEIMTKHLSDVPKRPSTLGVIVPEAVEDALMRSLAKKPEDRWETARDFRKALEVALRDGDVGLLETQRLSGDVVSQVRSSRPRPPTAGPVTTASYSAERPMKSSTSLSDVLEPGDSTRVPKQKKERARSLVPVIAITTVVVGAGVATALFLTKKNQGPKAKKSEIQGVAFTAEKTFGKLAIKTSGNVSVDEVEREYRAALAKVREVARAMTTPKAGSGSGPTPGAGSSAPTLEVSDPPLDAILTLPRAAMCEPTAYMGDVPPADCDVTLATVGIGPGGTKRLLIVDERSTLAKALVLGSAKALCTFPSDTGNARIAEICEIQEHLTDPP